MVKCQVLEWSFEAKDSCDGFLQSSTHVWQVGLRYMYMEISNLTLNVGLDCTWKLAFSSNDMVQNIF